MCGWINLPGELLFLEELVPDFVQTDAQLTFQLQSLKPKLYQALKPKKKTNKPIMHLYMRLNQCFWYDNAIPSHGSCVI